MTFYFATILLEKNRWSDLKSSSYSIIDWKDRILEGGYKGIELWEHHAFSSSPEELDQISDAFPEILFNCYADFSNSSLLRLEQTAAMISHLGAIGCKFNFGNDPKKLDEYIVNFKRWKEMLPTNFRFLCECHENTLLDTPESAVKILSQLGSPRVDAILHSHIDSPAAAKWFHFLGDRITHCHANYFRCGANPWNDSHDCSFDIEETLKIISRSSIRSISLEFVEGVGEQVENLDVLFTRALRDKEEIIKRII